MAKGSSKVTKASFDDSDDELNADEFASMIEEFESMIKREKSKNKMLESRNIKLEKAHQDALDKCDALLKEQVESKAYTKQIEDGFSKLKGLHVELSATHDSLVAKHDGLVQVHSKNIAAAKEREDKHQKLVHESKAMALKIKELEHALEHIDPSIAHSTTKIVVKVNASTSCEDLLPNPPMTNLAPKCSQAREKELEEEIESLRSCVAKLSKGEYLHQEMLFHHSRGFGKRGLGSFPEPNEGTTPSPEIKKCFIKEVGSYCQHCEVTGHHTRECPLPSRPLPTLPTNYKSMFDGKYFLLSKIK